MNNSLKCTVTKATGMIEDGIVDPRELEAYMASKCGKPALFKLELSAAALEAARKHQIGRDDSVRIFGVPL